MPYRSKGPRLYLRRARKDKTGEHAAVWLIRDGSNQYSTGCSAHDIAGAEKALAKYLASKHARAAREVGSRDPDQIPIADVLTLYLTEPRSEACEAGGNESSYPRTRQVFWQPHAVLRYRR